jgi:hypothetical protein
MMRRSFRQYSVLIVGAALLSAVAACAASPRNASFHSPDAPLPSASGLDPSAAPSASASASASPSKSPSKGPAPAPAPRGGKPGPGNTGPVAGTALAVVNGNQTFGTSGAVVSGKDFHGFVKVTGKNITFKNCVFRGGVASGNAALLDTESGSGTVIQDSEFVPAHPAATVDGIWASSTSIYRSNIHGSVDGVKTGSDVLIQDSYIHDMSWFASDPNQGGGETHNDGVQSFFGDARVTLRHNNIDMSTTKNGNAALQSSANDSHVDGNWLDGGGCSLNFDDHNVPLTGLQVTNNRFGRHSFYKCPILLSTKAVLVTNSGNVFDDTGGPIPPPQRHD